MEVQAEVAPGFVTVHRSKHEVRDAAFVADAIKAAREKAHGAKSARARAEALTEAAKAATLSADGMTLAMGLYLRAMRADPTLLRSGARGCGAFARGAAGAARDGAVAEAFALGWTGETAGAARCAAEELVSLYKRELRNRDRAKAMQKLVGRI